MYTCTRTSAAAWSFNHARDDSLPFLAVTTFIWVSVFHNLFLSVLLWCTYIFFLISPQSDLSQLHKCTFSLILNDASIISRKCTFMCPWQVKVWTHQGNMYVHHSNTVSNTLRNTGTHMQNCYGQETRWTSGAGLDRPPARACSRIRVQVACTHDRAVDISFKKNVPHAACEAFADDNKGCVTRKI